MPKNTYKTQSRKISFAYIARVLRFSHISLYGLPGHYMPRLLFLFCIGIFYVANTHYYEKTTRNIYQLEKEIERLRVDYTTLQAAYLFDSKQTEVAKRVTKMGLYETPYPPLKIKSC